MPDFLLDTRPPERRPSWDAARMLTWSTGIRSKTWGTPEFRLTVTWTGPDAIWSPWEMPGGTCAVVVGFLALDEAEWALAEREQPRNAQGGLAGYAVWRRCRDQGNQGWDDLSGNAAILFYDPGAGQIHLRTDPGGCFPVYGTCENGFQIWGSHPDVLAAVTGKSHRFDEVSLAEFVMASTVTPPYTYYRGIELCEPGKVLTWDARSRTLSQRPYLALKHSPDPGVTEEDLATVLAEAWHRAVRRRTNPRLGRVAVALSGGLDSRLVLASLADPRRAFAFTCYDTPNREFQTARAIASAVGVEFIPLQRSADYYGEHAAAGVRISGGMGTFANNHFLGVLDPLRWAGADLLLTGCYCDYLFKGLPLNRKTRWRDGHEEVAPFQHAFYHTRWHFDTALAREVFQRWEQRFPLSLQQGTDDGSLFHIETLRTFPLCYEGDNQQRLVPQRLMGWSPPVTDLEVLRVYQRTPSRWKLNRRLFVMTAQRLLAGSPLIQLPDANTGAPLDASLWHEALAWQWLRVRRKVRALRRRLASDGSWPDWKFYYRHSLALQQHWMQAAPEMHDLFLRVTGWRGLPRRPVDFPVDQCFLFVALLTLKLWWNHRACSVASSN